MAAGRAADFAAGGFDSAAPGTPARRWTSRLDALGTLEPPGAGARILVVAAHPDDETLGAGGILADAARAGAAVTVLVVTDGAGSHPHSATHPPERLARIRRDEAEAAVRALTGGRGELILLGLPDGRAAEHEDDIDTAVRAAAAGCTHVLATWRHDRHPDHEVCGRVAAAAAARAGAQLWEFPIWAWHWADPDGDAVPPPGAHAVALSPQARAAKDAALACYPSQSRPLSEQAGDEAVLLPGMLEHFDRPVEVVITTAPAASPAYFAGLYAAADDPWGLGERFYEARKRAAVLAALPRPRFAAAFEPGCATGLLTEALAARCDRVLAWDVAEQAVRQARDRTQAHPQVEVTTGRVPDEWPAGRFDLVLLSEVGYYCPDLAALAALATRAQASLTPDGVLLACHWRHPAAEHPQTAEAVHAAIGTGLAQLVHHVERDFLLDVWSRDGRSVAEAEGIVTAPG